MGDVWLRLATFAHLTKRFVGSLSTRPPSQADTVWAKGWLNEAEWALWQHMSVQDQRHSIVVAQRFRAALPQATSPEMAGALLHDVGKQAAGLGTFARVLATIFGRSTKRFAVYHDHEAIGAQWCSQARSAPDTVALVAGERGTPAGRALAAADRI